MMKFSNKVIICLSVSLLLILGLVSFSVAGNINSEAFKEGVMHGEIFKVKIETAVNNLLNELESDGYSLQELFVLAQENEKLYLEVLPEKVEWMKGVSEVTGIPYEEILILNDFSKEGCTGFAATGLATRDGVTMIAKNRDLSSQSLTRVQVMEHRYPKEESYRAAYIEIPQVKETYKYVASGTVGRWGFGQGINEFQVQVSDYAVSSDIEHPGRLGFHDNDFIRIVLERAKTAREAVEILGYLAENWGPAWNGFLFLVGDPNEFWVVEMPGNVWAAKRYENTAIITANQLQIEYDYDLASPDVISFALEQGWVKEDQIKDGKLNFREVYSKGQKYSPSSRTLRALELLESKMGDFTIQDFIAFERDHCDEVPTLEGKLEFEGKIVNMEQVPFYSSKYSNTNISVPMICSHGLSGRTTSSTVIVSDLNKFNELGAMWTALSQPCQSIFVPFYVGITSVPEKWTNEVAPEVFNLVRVKAFGRYTLFQDVIRAIFDPFEEITFQEALMVEKKVAAELKKGNSDIAKKILTDFCTERAIRALDLAYIALDRMVDKAIESEAWEREEVVPAGFEKIKY